MQEVEHRTLQENELYQRYGVLPPVMAELAREAECLLPNSAGTTVPLRKALPLALDKIRFLLHLCTPDDSDDNMPPFPQAS